MCCVTETDPTTAVSMAGRQTAVWHALQMMRAERRDVQGLEALLPGTLVSASRGRALCLDGRTWCTARTELPCIELVFTRSFLRPVRYGRAGELYVTQRAPGWKCDWPAVRFGREL